MLRAGTASGSTCAYRNCQAVVVSAQVGRPRALPPWVEQEIARLYRAGGRFGEIAAYLNAAGVPSAHGGTSWRSTVKWIVDTRGIEQRVESRQRTPVRRPPCFDVS